ncbi:hypothetical protein BJ875DRAFT_270317 [Amylocarpus encephaloides]|uniref:DUF2293 domain-containing protein n=1 Tax=Amylocarpus encephaloides TaxID=45428 RepID=A0A9P7YL13_9HELO|nr:hypothetical protein BJ875DRAFT_270317 [Amylocarpus encephaloides]
MVNKNSLAKATKAQMPAVNNGSSVKAKKASNARNQEDRRQKKIGQRMEKPMIAASIWDEPAPSHLVAKLDMPKVKSKYQSYFEFAENTEKKEKKLEIQITNDPKPPPGFTFVPFGDPVLTAECKELSRECGAMIFILSGAKEQDDHNKISAHVYRSGYHFREMLVEEARLRLQEQLGEPVMSRSTIKPDDIEPIPESQDAINKQTDAAIRDLFPRIPNTDRQMIIAHAFQKGVLFHGEPTVGLQADMPLSRRVQLAVLAHIRHNHTRYDKLLRETTWINARKAVEPVCLDILLKWRGDEETGRDQMDEILREVVIITDNEDDSSEDDGSEDDSSEEEGEITSASSEGVPSEPAYRIQQRPIAPNPVHPPKKRRKGPPPPDPNAISTRTRSRRAKGFKRYQAAWDDAIHRREYLSSHSTGLHSGLPLGDITNQQLPPNQISHSTSGVRSYDRTLDFQATGHQRGDSYPAARPEPFHPQHHQPREQLMHRSEVIVRPQSDPRVNPRDQPQYGILPHSTRDQRPPQVVRGSPERHGLKDMLVPSIEITASEPMRHVPAEERRNAYESFDHSYESHVRPVIETRRRSPPRRQVITIDGDSPQLKRRRTFYENDSGQFRPLPGRDHSVISAPHADSHLLSSLYAQPGYSSARRPTVQNDVRQGLSGSTSCPSSYRATKERVPIYDTPGQFRRTENFDPRQSSSATVIRHIAPVRPFVDYNRRSEISSYRPVHEDRIEVHSTRLDGNDHGLGSVNQDTQNTYPRRPLSPSVHASNRVSRSHDVHPSGIFGDQAFVHNFSQSRLNGSVHVRDGYNAVPERSRQMQDAAGGDSRGNEDRAARSYSTHPPARTRSPAGYMERPM